MPPDISEIQPVLLCGGVGARLHPLSTPEKPKPYLNLLSDDLTLLQETALRLKGALPPIIICHEDHVAMTRAQLEAVDIESSMIIAEPLRKNTAPAMALAVKALEKQSEQTLLFLPCDHDIGNIAAFRAAVREGINAAQEGDIVLFGEAPQYAETGYGYIQLEAGLTQIRSFHEKPDTQTAEQHIRDGYLWNTGIVMGKVSAFRDAFEGCAPDISDVLKNIDTPVDLGACSVSTEAFESMPSISFDVAVLEKHDRLKCVSVSMQWADIGHPGALKDRVKHVISGG